MLVIKDLHKSYDTGKSKLHVLKGINLVINEGELKVEGSVSALVEQHNTNLEQVFLKIVGYQPQEAA